MHEYLTIAAIEPNAWVVLVSNFLDKAPLHLWEARKDELELSGQPELLHSWDSFKEWCLSFIKSSTLPGNWGEQFWLF